MNDMVLYHPNRKGNFRRDLINWLFFLHIMEKNFLLSWDHAAKYLWLQLIRDHIRDVRKKNASIIPRICLSRFWYPSFYYVACQIISSPYLINSKMKAMRSWTIIIASILKFKILEEIVPSGTDTNTGRPGMLLWKIFVLGTLRLNCNWDYDKVKEMADNHRTLRLMLGHSGWEVEHWYPIQTIRDNVSLFTPEILDRINQIVVKTGHNLVLKKRKGKSL